MPAKSTSAAPAKVLRLVEQFGDNIDEYKATKFNEFSLRQQFIDPLFAALGWDMDNSLGHAEAYKDVIHEDAIKVGSATKAPDYCFRIGGTRKFFLEAKKPSVHIKGDPSPAYQLRRYGFSAQLPLSILTDFEEFAVYDCRIRPDQKDKADKARILYLTYDEYPTKWQQIADVFSRDAILKGSFDKYAESARGKRGTSTLNSAFLDQLCEWRVLLAKNLALRNPDLSERDLNYAVQMTLDRIVFLRMCEDRGIEIYGRLLGLVNGEKIYDRLKHFFREADERYNSGLFHFRKEKDRPDAELDELTPRLALDDKVLREIIKGLYYPDCPFEFSVIPLELLGHVYEQFLGQVIRLTASHQAKVEEKPEVKKAGGVYYTPNYIVDYIVRQTVGKLLGEPGDGSAKAAAKLRVLDPACGSGSFLLGAYDFLLKWHRDQYLADGPEKHRKELFQTMGGEWRLTNAERKRILLNNIYGVDIDRQAVEVTKLSLLLKVLEGESKDSMDARSRLFHHERALPDLSRNIKCGNSLIGPDFYDGQQLSMFDDEERYRINVFDWNAAFPEIMKAGGFDAVIGNPPYIRIQNLQESAPLEVEHYKESYAVAAKGNYDIYVVFVERGLQLLFRSGCLGFILPHKFFTAQYGESLRSLLASGRHVRQVTHFGDKQVFDNATTYTCVLFLEKTSCKEVTVCTVDDLDVWRKEGTSSDQTVSAKALGSGNWLFGEGKQGELLEKLRSMPLTLGRIADRIAQGIRTSANEIYVLDVVNRRSGMIRAYSKALDEEVAIEEEITLSFLRGREIKAHRISPSGKAVLVPYRLKDQRASLISESEMKRSFPKAFAYLQRNRAELEQREDGRMRGPGWYAYVYPKNLEVMQAPKILVPDIGDRAAFALDLQGKYV